MQSTPAEVVTAEIRAECARQRMNQAALAKRLDENEIWVSRRLRGIVALSVNDLFRICDVLGVEPSDLVVTARPARIAVP